jgi:hypothetical protein
MPDFRRGLILLVIVALGAILAATIVRPRPERAARWPADDSLYELDGWVARAPEVTLGQTDEETRALVQRVLVGADGTQAALDLWTNPQPQAKMLFRKGPDRDFLGAGYTSEPLPSALLPIAGGGAIVARRGSEAWLLVYTYGERRGLLGNEPLAWGLAEWDALMDQPNDYFLARIALPFDAASSPPPIATATSLSQILFPRLAAWYAHSAY